MNRASCQSIVVKTWEIITKKKPLQIGKCRASIQKDRVSLNIIFRLSLLLLADIKTWKIVVGAEKALHSRSNHKPRYNSED